MTALAALRAALEGPVLGPGEPGYDEARAVFDARVDVRPVAIARCASRDDVGRALGIAGDHGLPVAVRGGGTTPGATVAGGVVLDLSPLRRIEVDPARRLARVEPGVTWAELDAATQAHGLAVTGARVSRLGVVGTALGDGSGWLERALGPTGASVASTAAIGGVVTRLDLRLHPLGPVLLAGFLGFPRDRAREVAAAYRDFMADAPAEVGGGLVLGAGLGGACTVVFSYAGPVEAGKRAVAPLRALGPSLDAVAPNPYVALQHLWDASHPAGTRAHLQGAALRELPDAALEAAVAGADRPAASLSYLFLRRLGGALGDPAPWSYQAAGLWPPVPALDAGQVAWVEGLADALAPWVPAP